MLVSGWLLVVVVRGLGREGGGEGGEGCVCVCVGVRGSTLSRSHCSLPPLFCDVRVRLRVPCCMTLAYLVCAALCPYGAGTFATQTGSIIIPPDYAEASRANT